MKTTEHEYWIHQTHAEAVPCCLYIKQDEWEDGDFEQGQEAHIWSHTHHVVRGSATVWKDAPVTVNSPGGVEIEANRFHRITASPGTITQCIHVLRRADGSGRFLEPDDVPAGATALSVAQPITVL